MRRHRKWQDEWAAIYRDVGEDIFGWCELLRFDPTFYQREVLQDIQDGHIQIATVSGQGPGKTALVTAAATWRTFRAYKAMTVLTSPTQRQCRDVFLAECQRTMDRAHPALQRFIDVTKSKVVFGGVRDWDIKIATATEAANIAGYHENNMTFILEEAQGIPQKIVETIEGTLTNLGCQMIAIGNPNTRNCAFASFFDDDSWQQHRFNTEEDAPKLLKAKNPVHRVLGEGLVARNERLERKYGRESDVYRVRVQGRFPSQDPNCVISADDLWACTKTDMVSCAMERPNLRAFGTDLAAFGGDECVVYQLQGNAIIAEWQKTILDPAVAVKHSFRMQSDSHWMNPECIHVFDMGGLGAGVRHLYYNRPGGRHHPFVSNGKARDSREYADRLTEAFFFLAELAKTRRIHIPKDAKLIKQLSSRQYELDVKTRLVVESKKVFRKRMVSEGQSGESPDRADALVMAFYAGVVAKAGRTARQELPGRKVGIEGR